MGLLGTLLGGTLGWMFGGPIGAVIGGTLGSNLDVGGGESMSRNQFRDPRQAQTAFLVALVSLAAKVSKADGRVDETEIRAFDRFLREGTTMDAEERRHAARIFNEARDTDVPATEFARQIRGLLAGQPDRLRDMVLLLLQIAHADGEFHPAEEAMIRDVARAMGLSDRDYEACRAYFGGGGGGATSARAPLEDDYAVLGLTSAAGDDEVKTSYRRLAREYHPDVLQSKGLPEDFMTFATEKLQRINEAYDRIKTASGM